MIPKKSIFVLGCAENTGTYQCTKKGSLPYPAGFFPPRKKYSDQPGAGRIIPMPWPATHILIAEQVYSTYFSHLEKAAFILGTSFPDIRYLAKIDRNLTHINHLPLEEIQDQTPFTAGLYFHSLTDAAWNAYIRKHGERLFTLVPHNRAMFHTLKILQDKYLYPQFEGWTQVSALFTDILPEERLFGIPEDLLQGWHAALAAYLAKPPRFEDLTMLQLTLPAPLVREISTYYRAYGLNPDLQEIMTHFFDVAEELLIEVSPKG
jgi:hypothetical protein